MKIIIVGGGAAGFWAAITCAQTYPQAQVQILEASRDLLSKVRISGGGRCNVTHACFEPAALVQNYPRGAKALRGAFSRFQPQDTIAWFKAQGVRLVTEADGRMFPSTNNSATIVNCLTQSAQLHGVTMQTSTSVASIVREGCKFRVGLKNQDTLLCDRILLATGSTAQGYRLAQSLGHDVIPPVPSLFTFNVADQRLQELAGISVNPVHLQLQVSPNLQFQQTGAFLITHWGFSGPAVLKLSAWAARALHVQRYQAQLIINWLPQMNLECLRQTLLDAKFKFSQRAIARYTPLPLPSRLWERLTAYVGIAPDLRWANLANKTLNVLLQELNQGRYQIQGKGVFKDEFVTCGGVCLDDVNFKTMESRKCPGLFFAGEILDIDGITGGFNFQSAWTTGWLAGQSLGKP
jgi:predicted Rossmann fold flavoprotein